MQPFAIGNTKRCSSHKLRIHSFTAKLFIQRYKEADIRPEMYVMLSPVRALVSLNTPLERLAWAIFRKIDTVKGSELEMKTLETSLLEVTSHIL